MRTLLENITFVKGVEYLIVVAFCFGFIALWILVHKEKGATKKIVSIIIPLSLIFGGGAIVFNKYFDPDITAGAIPQNTENISKSPNINSDYFTIDYGPAIEFHNIMGNKVSCSTCHHNSNEIKACKDCHDKPFDPSNPNKPGLKAAYHQRCISCHQNKFNGPDSCVHCHTGKTVQISTSIPHKLTWENCNRCHSDDKGSKIVYHDNCLTCHSKKAGGATQLPVSHTGRAGNTCQGCHKPIGG